MYQQEETNWFGQTIQTYKDKIYGTNGYLRISISTNSNNLKDFNPPQLHLMIKNNHSKNLSLSGENSLELAMALGQAINSFKGDKIEVVKKFKHNLQFILELFQHEGNSLVKITLLSNSSDFTVIIIPLFPTFMFLGRIIKDFSNNYFNICENMFYQAMNSKQNEIILQLPSLLKGIINQVEMPIERQDPHIDTAEIEKTEVTINDLDKFIGGNEMSNVKVPEIDNHQIEKKLNKPVFTDVESKFVTNILKNDLSSLENTISGLSVSHNPVEDFRKRLIEDGGYEDDFNPLLGIKENDLKSLCYISRFTFLMCQKNYVDNGGSIPQGFSPLLFKTESQSDSNNELAYDLLLFNGYIKSLRSKLEMRISSAVENKSIFHLAYRCFLDPFIFSFISNIEKDQLVSIILNRFRCYDSKGIFDKYKTLCLSYGIDKVKEDDVKTVIENIAEMILDNGGIPSIDNLHKDGYEARGLRLSIENDFNLEQITNEIIPLEVAIKLNNNEITDELIGKVKEKENISNEIIEFFKKKHTPVKTVDKNTSVNLQKMIEKFKDQVPKEIKDKFDKYIIDLGDKNFEFDNVDFPYEQMGDDIIKLLYFCLNLIMLIFHMSRWAMILLNCYISGNLNKMKNFLKI